MARSDHLKALLRSHREGDDSEFRATAERIIEDERRKKHDLLADELVAILDEPVRTRRTPTLGTLRPLPKGRDETQLLSIRQPERTLQDLVLPEPTHQLLVDVLEEQRVRSALRAHGIGPRSAVLFVGPSGTGKSATAEAMAGELGWPIAHVQLASVVSPYLGETAKNLEQIFSFLKSGSWVLLFDEFDMLARDRSERGDHGELKRVVATLLQLIEESDTDSLIIATTNHSDLMDAALCRRFDEILSFDLPGAELRKSLVSMKLRSVRSNVDLDKIAERLEGSTPAEIEAVAYDALRLMVRNIDREVTDSHVEYGLNRMEERRRTILGSRG